MTQSAAVLELQHGELRMALRPDLGGSIAGLWRSGLPVLRSGDAAQLASSRQSACYPLLPYSNRLAGRRFSWLGREYTTQPNFDDSPHSLHGIGWQRAWRIDAQSEHAARLSLQHGGDADWPFAFDAEQRFRLDAAALHIELALTNRAPHAAPAGLGWHPYFARRARSRLHAEVTQRWDNDASGLPIARVAQSGIDGDVAHLRFDNCFEGFSGAARIRDESLSLRLGASLAYLVVYTPDERDYFCVEPVSHVSDAIHAADPAALGLRSLLPGETMTASMLLDIADVHRG